MHVWSTMVIWIFLFLFFWCFTATAAFSTSNLPLFAPVSHNKINNRLWTHGTWRDSRTALQTKRRNCNFSPCRLLMSLFLWSSCKTLHASEQTAVKFILWSVCVRSEAAKPRSVCQKWICKPASSCVNTPFSQGDLLNSLWPFFNVVMQLNAENEEWK